MRSKIIYVGNSKYVIKLNTEVNLGHILAVVDGMLESGCTNII